MRPSLQTLCNRTILVARKNHLEEEKNNFLMVLKELFDNLDEEIMSFNGRPPACFKDIMKSLLIMSFNGMSYRRSQSDLLLAKTLGIINAVPKKSTLCKYMNKEELREEISSLIQKSAMPFMGVNHTLILDSTWFGTKMYVGGHDKKPTGFNSRKNNDIPSLKKCRKLHAGILKESRIIAYAEVTNGTTNDSPLFQKIVSNVINNGFLINTLLADAGYLSKSNYAFAQDNGVENIFIDFRKNITGKRAKSKAWRASFNLYKNDNEYWHEIYRFRVLIESVWSSMKRKFTNWLRTKTPVARDNEMLLKALCYNLTILAKNINYSI